MRLEPDDGRFQFVLHHAHVLLCLGLHRADTPLFRKTLDLYRKGPGGQTSRSETRLAPGRFGSSRKKEAARVWGRRGAIMGF